MNRARSGTTRRRFIHEADRGQWTLLPERFDDFIDESNPVRVIDAFVDTLDLAEMSFDVVEPAATGRPSYHPSAAGFAETLELAKAGWKAAYAMADRKVVEAQRDPLGRGTPANRKN